MRCIEMKKIFGYASGRIRLTLTWDVLKWLYGAVIILICHRLTLTWDVLKFPISAFAFQPGLRLTLTWDVLKWDKGFKVYYNEQININMRCIEIYPLGIRDNLLREININMRCIEII